MSLNAAKVASLRVSLPSLVDENRSISQRVLPTTVALYLELDPAILSAAAVEHLDRSENIPTSSFDSKETQEGEK